MNIKSTVLAVVLFSLSAPSYAAFSCQVDVTAVLPYASGAVNVRHSGRGDFTYICSLKAEYAGVSVATCAMWTSMLTQAMKDARKVEFYYSSTATVTACSNLPTYGNAPVPVYIGYINR